MTAETFAVLQRLPSDNTQLRKQGEMGAFRTLCAIGIVLLTSFASRAESASESARWPIVTREMRPWAYWWWMGSAVDKANLTRELQRYHEAGYGGVHIIPIYGAKGWETNYINYLSPRWMEMLKHTVDEAKRLDMGVDMTTGTGWCFGGPHVTDDEANASAVVKTFDVTAGSSLTEKFDPKKVQLLAAFSTNGTSVELTKKIRADGSVDWTAPAGTWRIYAISQKPSGQKVKRPSPGGEGHMLNLIYPEAVKHFIGWFDEVFAKYDGPKPRAQYHDSYEYKSDWSPDFFAQFEKRRGYKLQNELPALFGKEESGHAARVLCDYRETVSDIMAEDSLPLWVKWSHDHGFITRNEAHGSPGNLLDLYAVADVPETEMFYKDRSKLISKFASSAAHVSDKKLVGCETGTWLKEHFTETLADVKYLLDDVFLSGVNHVFYHGTCYSPDEAGWPGWHFYASLEMNPRNSIWRDAPALNAYIARCQSILQSGKPDNDILLYWPIHDFWSQPGGKLLPHLTVHARDWFEAQPVGHTAEKLWERGYSFDYVSDRQLASAKVKDGKIRVPGGEYKVIVVPECKLMPLETLKRLFALAEKGATVIFDKQFPLNVSGWNNLKSEEAELKDLKSKPVRITTESYRANIGFVIYELGLGTICTGGVPFDGTKVLENEREVAREPLVDSGLSFIRRSFEGGWNYFVANRSDKNFDGWISFDRPAKSVVLLDPLTGRAGVAASRESRRSVSHGKQPFVSPIEIHLVLDAGESVILRAFVDGKVEGPGWNYWQASSEPTEISGTWNVSFIQGGLTIPAPFQISKLGSWTDGSDTNAQNFAGTAKYEITFDAPKSGGKAFELNLGKVCQSARVRVNGKDFGTLITPPFRVIVDNLKPTGNTLEVEVTNVSANRIRDLDRRGVKWKTFNDINFVNIDYKPFDASNWPLTDSGLLGPVTIAPVVPVQLVSTSQN